MGRKQLGWIASLASLAMFAGGVSGCGGEVLVDDGNAVESDEIASNPYTWWRGERARRLLDISGYLINHNDEVRSFKNTPLGFSGIPAVMFRLLPELFPEVWGDSMINVGFGKDPFEPSRVFPLGTGYAPSPSEIQTPAGPIHLQVSSITCAACHVGRVAVQGTQTVPIVGAPNNLFNQYRRAVGQTISHPNYTADKFRAALNAKPAGWVYNDPAMLTQETLERAVFNSPGAAEQMLAQVKAGAIAGGTRFAQTIGAYTYHAPNSPNPQANQPGLLDAIAFGIMLVTDPAVLTPAQLAAALPPAPAEVDLMSVWGQADRSAAQWDGSIVNPTYRNLAASVAVVGDPRAVNMDNINKTTRLTANLPAPPYPFDVNQRMANRGEKLYQGYCASCHRAGNAKIFPTAQVGTDANRANIWTPFSAAGLTQLFRLACTDPATCKTPTGGTVPDSDIVRITGGYMALPLSGLWARAPYLHNGSVPTLEALLTGVRPAKFERGNNAYDQKAVGFVWNAAAPGSSTYDTALSGHSNKGHDTAQFNGSIDWNKNRDKLADLLEYLKTL